MNQYFMQKVVRVIGLAFLVATLILTPTLLQPSFSNLSAQNLSIDLSIIAQKNLEQTSNNQDYVNP